MGNGRRRFGWVRRAWGAGPLCGLPLPVLCDLLHTLQPETGNSFYSVHICSTVGFCESKTTQVWNRRGEWVEIIVMGSRQFG